MSRASPPPTSPADGTRGLVKAHRIALIPNDRQASLMAEHAGWARVASNWSRDRFADAWFTGEDEDNEWLSDMDLRKQFNAVKRDLFAWSVDLSQNVAKNAIIHTSRGLDAWGAYKKALKKGKRPRAGWVSPATASAASTWPSRRPTAATQSGWGATGSASRPSVGCA
ncbi:MAG: hypothetical protein F4Y80_12230 [Caldilineaceae bacterium SB0665_bin_21]|nr:hypothetical protein [Caldilineaceae bacterium SB0665_bin_21]MYC62155.1 hypothetical protein [Caldilineaceae bacterium SB0661_bin_34]